MTPLKTPFSGPDFVNLLTRPVGEPTPREVFLGVATKISGAHPMSRSGFSGLFGGVSIGNSRGKA